MQQPTTLHRSPSQLKTFTKCGERFRLERMVEPPLPKYPAAWTLLGTTVHAVAEYWEKTHRPEMTDQQIMDVFDWYYQAELANAMVEQPDLSLWTKTPAVKTTENDINLRREEGRKQAVDYIRYAESAPWKPYVMADGSLALEVPFEISLPSPEEPDYYDPVMVRGKVDLIKQWPDGQLTICDMKTGSAEDEVDDRQLGTYRVAMEMQYDLPIRYGEYWFTKTRLQRSSGMVDLSRWTPEFAAKQYYVLDEAVVNNLFLPNPTAKNCGFCEVKDYCSVLGSKSVT